MGAVQKLKRLRVQLLERVRSLTGISDSVMASAVAFCSYLPIAKAPDSVYEDEGDVVLYWKTGDIGSILLAIDDLSFHYFIRKENGEEISKSDIKILG